MRNASFPLFLILSLCCISSCDRNRIVEFDSGPCEYVDYPGIATIETIGDADPEGNNCKDAVEVIFTFVPDDSSAISRYLFPDWPDSGVHFIVGDGKNPPRSWVSNIGMTEGSEHRCVRSEITAGTCTPVGFSFPDIDVSGYAEDCF